MVRLRSESRKAGQKDPRALWQSESWLLAEKFSKTGLVEGKCHFSRGLACRVLAVGVGATVEKRPNEPTIAAKSENRSP